MYSVNAVDINSVSWVHKLQLLKKPKRSSVMFVAMASQQQQLLRQCFNMLINSIKRNDRLKPESLQMRSQYPRKV